MYAVIVSGGKQHRVEKGETLKLEKIESDVGAKIKFDRVLLVADGSNVHIGEPIVQDATVEAKIISHGRGKKIRIIKFKRRKHHLKQAGHRQWFTEVEITGIKAGKAKSSSDNTAKAEASKPAATKATEKKAAAKPAAAKPAVAKPAAAKKAASTVAVEKEPVKKAPAKKAPAKKTAAKKETTKAPAKKAAATKSTTKKEA